MTDKEKAEFKAYIEQKRRVANPPKGTSFLSALSPQKQAVDKVATEAYESVSPLVRGLMDVVPETVGAVGFGAVNPLLAPVGAMAGEAVEQLGKRAINTVTGKESFKLPESKEAAWEIGKSGMFSAAGEGALRLAGMPFKLAAQGGKVPLEGFLPKGGGIVRKANPNMLAENVELSKKYLTSKGLPPLTPAQQTEEHWYDVIHNIIEKSWTGAEYQKEAQSQIKKAATGMVEDLVEGYRQGRSATDVRHFVGGVIAGKRDAFKATMDKAYSPVFKAADASDVKIDMRKVTSWLKNYKKVNGIKLDNDSFGLIDDVLQRTEKGTFSLNDFHQLKEYLGSVAPREAGTGKAMVSGQWGRTLSGLKNKIDDTFQASKNAYGEEKQIIFSKYTNLGIKYREGINLFSDDVTKELLKSDRHLVLDTLITEKNPELVHKVLYKTLNPEARELMRGEMLQKVLREAGKDSQGYIHGSSFLKLLEKVDGAEGTLKEWFTKKDTLNAIKGYAKILSVIEEKQGAGAGGMLIQLLQPGAIAALATGVATDSKALTIVGGTFNIAILGGPMVAARMFSSPTIVKFLVEGAQLGQGTAAMARLTTQLAAQLQKEGFPFKKLQEKPPTKTELDIMDYGITERPEAVKQKTAPALLQELRRKEVRP